MLGPFTKLGSIIETGAMNDTSVSGAGTGTQKGRLTDLDDLFIHVRLDRYDLVVFAVI